MIFFEQVFGSLTHNNAAPAATNLGALVAVASSAAPTYNAGDQVLLSVDLAGNLRTIITNTPAVAQSGVWSVEVNDGTNVVFTSGHPAYIQGSVGAIQSGSWSVDAIQSGSWAVTISSGAVTSTDNITEWNSVALGSPTAYGTPPSGNVIGVNAYVTTLPAITVAAAQTIAVTNAGTFAVQASGTVTAEIVGHSGVVLDAVLGATKPANVLAVGGNDGTNAYAIAMGTGGRSTIIEGISGGAPITTRPAAPTNSQWLSAPINFSSSGLNTIVAGVGGQTIRVMRMFFVNCSSSSTTSVTIQDSTPTLFTGAMLMSSAGVLSNIGDGEPYYTTGVGKGLQLNNSAAVQISGTVWYTQS